MSFRFFRRAHVAPGLTVNLSRSGPSLSMGVRGAHVTVGRRGLTRTVGVPGTGVFWTSRIGLHSGYHSATVSTPRTTPAEQATADHDVERAIVVALLMAFAALVGWWLAQ
jgi:hypothetical protein